MDVDLSASVGVNQWPDLVDGLINMFFVLRGNVLLDAVFDFLLGELSVSRGVALLHNFSRRWASSLESLGKVVGPLVVSHGLGKLVLVNLTVAVLVNVLKASINHIVGLFVLLWVSDVGVNAGMGLLNVDSTGSIRVTGIDNIGRRWSITTLLGEG